MDLEKELIETWDINSRINLYLLDAIDAKSLNDLPSSKGRTLAEQVAHLHNARLMWLGSAAPELLEGLSKIEKEHAAKKPLLRKSLQASGCAISELIKKSLKSGGRVKGFKPHVTAFVGYLISHEAHHRGQIALTLKESGHALEKKVAYGIWEWGVR